MSLPGRAGRREPGSRGAGKAARGGEVGRPPPGEADWISFREAVARIVERCRRLDVETVSPGEAPGRALAEDILSPVDHPPWDASAMDGFAVRAEDVAGASPAQPVTLPLSGDVAAGCFPEGPLRPGTAVRVMTGAPVPAGATGVVRVEHTDGGSGASVAFYADSDARRNIRRAGEDVRRGAVLLQAGQEVTPASVAALALAGARRLRVVRRPRVAVLATGDELAELERYEEVAAGRKLADTNSHALCAQVRAAGGVPVPLGIARDDPASIRARIEAAGPWDALLSSGGVSVGARDHVKATLEALGLERVFWRVKVRPGSPLLFGLIGGRPCWALPGNPVSALVAFELFVRPGLRRMGGFARLERRRFRVRVRGTVEASPGVTHFFRVRLEETPEGELEARLTGPQGSGRLTSMVEADALLVVPEGVGRLEDGSSGEVIPLRE